MPYIGFRGEHEVRFGRSRLLSVARFTNGVVDPALADRLRAILSMHREVGRRAGGGQPLRGIGIIAIGKADCRPFNRLDYQAARELRYALFLCCLAHNNRVYGPNAGFSLYTSENFDVIYQSFVLDSDYISERNGVLVSITSLGQKIGETEYPKPSHIHIPLSFNLDENLLAQISWLRKHNRALYRRVMRATAVFLESYYNAPNVDTGARILLQAAAFEVLLDLPEKQPRKVFKDAIERLTNEKGDRRIRYMMEVWGEQKPETRTVKGMWADRFYTLRNHIIHGQTLSDSEYMFRGKQHHVLIAPQFFVMAARKLIDEVRVTSGCDRATAVRIDWVARRGRGGDLDDEPEVGFSTQTNFHALVNAYAAQKARRSVRRGRPDAPSGSNDSAPDGA